MSPPPSARRLRALPRLCLLAPLALLAALPAMAQPAQPAHAADRSETTNQAAPQPHTQPRTLAQWLHRLQQAARLPAYSGTFVVSAPEGLLASARIWHACEAAAPGQPAVELERVETLSGPPRTTLRRNGEVLILQAGQRPARMQSQASANLFHGHVAPGQEEEVARHYSLRVEGQGRVAGLDADIVHLAAKDAWRHDWRIWSERQTGLVIQTQTLDAQGRVLEQSAFSELQLLGPARAGELAARLRQSPDWQQSAPEDAARPLRPVSARAQGWTLRSPVAGFVERQCVQRRMGGHGKALMQWVFSDGLATVSLFLEPHDERRPRMEGAARMGATHTLTLRLPADGPWWLTAVGEVPLPTLQAFAQALERVQR